MEVKTQPLPNPETLPREGAEATYVNPVHLADCADPFVLKFRGEYWCYTTGFRRDGKCFGIFHSRDLVTWREVGGAMEPLPGGHTCYWAPEVWCENGRFLLYYSVGNEERMQIRVAVADSPTGPFVDSGHTLTSEEFAIDAHVFEDDDGTRWLFYAADFLTHSHIGTGTVRDRMLDPFTLEGRPQPVTRARYDWQVYDPQRESKGGVRWHTVEGPFVLKRKGKYYEMFSGGNWQQPTYGVSYALTHDLRAMDEWEQVADGERVAPLLRTIPGEVIGPGHNSVVRGPDNRQLFCVYHRWNEDASERVLAIDRLDWADERMVLIGPTTSPQPAPTMPTFADYFAQEYADGLGESWACVGGHWSVREGAARQEEAQKFAEARCSASARSFCVEVSLCALTASAAGGGYGLLLRDATRELLRIELRQAANRLVLIRAGAEQEDAETMSESQAHGFDLPAGFAFDRFHLLRVEVDEQRVKVALDGSAVKWEGELDAAPEGVSLFTARAAAAFSGFALTVGWEDLFEGGATEDGENPEAAGWIAREPSRCWRIGDGKLWYASPHGQYSALAKGPLLDDYEFVVSATMKGELTNGEGYGFYPAVNENWSGPLVFLRRGGAGWTLTAGDANGLRAFSLPLDFDPSRFNHFRFRKRHGRLTMQHESQVLGEIEVGAVPTRVGLCAHKIVAVFDAVRVTALS